MARDTLIDLFRDLSRARGTFLVYDDGFRSRQYGYADVGRAARLFAMRLDAAGVRKGDKVVFWSENRPEWVVAFWGCLLIGAIVVPIDYRASPDFVARIAKIVSAKLVLIGHDVSPSGESIAAPIWPLADICWVDGTLPSDPGAPIVPGVNASRDDIAEIVFTSGATGDPKGVLITHRNVLANIVPVEQEILKYRALARLFSPLRFLNLLPLSHMFGQAMATFIPPLIAGEVVFMRGYNPADIVDQIKRRRVSVLVSVPKILDVLREQIARIDPTVHDLMAGRGNGTGGNPAQRWWRYREVHRLFGMKFWAFVAGAAPLDGSLEAFWSELGFAMIQGYGLTETAPIVTLNHPFATRRGSVGKAIPGVEMKVATDGEILVRGENVTSGYFNADTESAHAFESGWFHTGDIGEIAADGQLYIRGRKKEMIVTPEGLNVFPQDVERVVDALPGVRESAAVGVSAGSEERVNVVLVLEPGTDADTVVRTANARLADHQRIRRAVLWPGTELPRTEGTRKLKRGVVRQWLMNGAGSAEAAPTSQSDPLAALVSRYASRADLSPSTTLDELGLSSLERVELMVALEEAFQTRIDESAFAEAHNLGQLESLLNSATQPIAEPMQFPAWNRSRWARLFRRVGLPVVIVPLTRAFAWLSIEGRQHLESLEPPVIFAANHQSLMDAPVIMAALPSRLRYRLAPAMAKEFFEARFHPERATPGARFTSNLNYFLAALVFNAFPLPQHEAGARQTMRYIGDVLEGGDSVLIFPEGRRTEHGEIVPFRPGIGMIAARMGVQVVPVRIEGLDKVLHASWSMAVPGRVRVAFGQPMRLEGEDYQALARQVEERVKAL